MSQCDSILWGHLRGRVYCTNVHSVQELQAGGEAAAEEIPGDMLHDTVDNFVVHLHEVHMIKESHVQRMFT